MIKVAFINTQTNIEDIIEESMRLGNLGLTNILGQYEEGYVVASKDLNVDEEVVDEILDCIMCQPYEPVTIGEAIEVEVVL